MCHSSMGTTTITQEVTVVVLLLLYRSTVNVSQFNGYNHNYTGGNCSNVTVATEAQ